MKGFREVGLSGAVVGMLAKVLLTGEGREFAGETARLRKGLLDGRFVVSPGDICRLPDSGGVRGLSVNPRKEL